MAVTWLLVPSSLEELTALIYAARTSAMSVNFYQTAGCNNPEDSHLPHSLLSGLQISLSNLIIEKNPGKI
jgi:hypothetical protein